ncbi:nitric oxide synthase oxygenase [Actinoplanes missouriensis]|uniref:nitric oxide synthase oxygenase n=1 Tax=Actinoplanes missouriensis TaxID=1866 RepID=UPI0033C690F5
MTRAEEFLTLFHAESKEPFPLARRLAQVRAEITHTGTYAHTGAELEFGARVAWRNSKRCIGRLYWRNLTVRDLRTVDKAKEIFLECAQHLRDAYNGGRIRPMITVFAPERPDAPGPRIFNEQLIRYAGYQRADGTVVGDPRHADLTARVQALGWRGSGSRFDVLPLVIGTPTEPPQLFDLPVDAVHEVTLEHPEFDWFADLGLRWHALPVISGMALEIGGVRYPAAPFNGWYMGTEIGARNLVDEDRYNVLPAVAARMGLDTGHPRTLWKDRALVEVNRAVLWSFHRAGVSVTDHHTESARFLRHLAREERAGRRVPADWTWIVPPMSGSLTPVFHRYYDDVDLSPGYLPNPAVAGCPWDGAAPSGPPAEGRADACPVPAGRHPDGPGSAGRTHPEGINDDCIA